MKKFVVAVLVAVALVVTPSAEAGKSKGAPSASKVTVAPAATPVDINNATKAELAKLPGIGDIYADKIIAGRPYRTKTDLKTRKILPEGTFSKVQAVIIAKQN